MKPRVFIGSSREALQVAETVQQALAYETESVLWSQGIFRNMNVPIEDLMNAIGQFDFAVFVFFPQDYVTFQGEQVLSIRDNVLFELGMFLGRLGRERNFFVAPDGDGKLKFHLPSDLSGITPIKYDSSAKNRLAAMGTAVYEIKEAIRSLGTVTRQQTVLYDSEVDFKPYHFEHNNASIWQDDKPITAKGEGKLTFLPDGTLKLTRTNTVGRNEIVFRRNGPKRPSILKKADVALRILHFSCEARVEGGSHQLRFVAKDIAAGSWIHDRTVFVAETDFAPFDVYLHVPATADLFIRIDYEEVSAAPSTLFLRNLKIEEEPY